MFISAAAQSAVVLDGSIDFLFGLVTPDVNKQLQVQIPDMRIRVEAPEPNSDGSGVRYRITGAMRSPAAGAEVTWTLKNQTASY